MLTDMSKAFDSLHPPLLLSKLKAYGFQDNVVELLKIYLSNRKNRVKMGSNISSNSFVNRVCPQGSALGPLLWNVFPNDLFCHVRRISMYADDISFTTQVETYLLLYQNLEIVRKQQLSGTRKSTLPKLSNFNSHISIICKKASQRIGVLIRLRNLIPTDAKLQLFRAAILPYLTYRHLIWHFCRSSDSRRLERVQERGLTAVYKDKHSTYGRFLQKTKLPTLLNRRLVKHNLSPLNICNIFQEHNSSIIYDSPTFQFPGITQ